MAPLPLISGAYSAQSLIADAQRSINLYPEKNPENTRPPMPVTHYPRPGLTVRGVPPVQGTGRCLYAASNGALYAVVGNNIYFINSDFVFTLLGVLQTPGNIPVIMADNGTTVMAVDGDQTADLITLGTNAFAFNGDPNFLGARGVDFIDGFLVMDVVGTNKWQSTLSQSVTFNLLYQGVKTASPDPIQRVICCERQVYLLGTRKSEPWVNVGSVPFPFAIQPGMIIEQGCAAAYSACKQDTNVYWLSQSPEGARMIMKVNAQNVAERISTHAIEAEFLKYARVDDCIADTYQIAGHSFIRFHFPTADKTWVYDQATEQWFEDNWIDNNGQLHRARNVFSAYAYGTNLGIDWANGTIYKIDPAAFTDAGQPIAHIRSFPHIINEMKYVNHVDFVADFETGTLPASDENLQITSPWSPGFSKGFGPLNVVDSPTLNLRYSNDGGNTWSNNRPKKMMSAGRYRSMMRWRGLGKARDRVYEVGWSAPMKTALQGAYYDAIPGAA